MPCFAPLTGYFSKDVGPSGKRPITFNRMNSLSGAPLTLPCGQCVGCRLERSRQWAMRCLHENKLHRQSCFATLTYDNVNLPAGGTLVKRDLQLFMKRLRKAREPDQVRFYACGEYGDVNKRPHYHALLFGCDFPDKLSTGANRRGDAYFESKELADIWSLGRVMVGAVSFDSAAYVARYVLKKITGDGAASHYEVRDGYGEIFNRLPEFTVMSRRPGIGAGYYERFGAEVRAHDSVVVNARLVRPPRFYDSRFEVLDPVAFSVVKRKRKRMAVLNRKDNTVDRRRVKETLCLLQLKRKERSL